MGLPEIGEDVKKAYRKIRKEAEERLESPKSVNIYLADDGDVHVRASHNEARETEQKEWETYAEWETELIIWKRSDPVIRYKELVSESRSVEKSEVIES